jgi:hypothetical protein
VVQPFNETPSPDGLIKGERALVNCNYVPEFLGGKNFIEG